MYYVRRGSIPQQSDRTPVARRLSHGQNREEGNPMSVRWTLLALTAVNLAACSSAPPSAMPTESTPKAAVSSSPSSTVRPTPTAPPALVGTWLGVHNCQRIIDIMTSADMPEQALLNAAESGTIPGVTTVDAIADPENPCVGAVDVQHSHFFTASGLFGSRDARGQQVDDGRWELVDADTFEINGTPFDFQVDGDELRMQPVDVGTCPETGEWCAEAWRLMVAMPGMAWTRSAD